MKKYFKNIVLSIQILCLFLSGTNICYADEPIVGVNVLPFKTVLIKFAVTMGSVLISLLIIWIILRLYKQYYFEEIQKINRESLYGDKLDTPKNIDDALISFIDKNKLQRYFVVKKKNAMGAIEMLLVLLVVSILFIAIMPMFRSYSNSGYINNSTDKKSIQDSVNEQVNQIEQMKKQNEEITKRMNQDN